jgi:MoxR-like ATPase
MTAASKKPTKKSVKKFEGDTNNRVLMAAIAARVPVLLWGEPGIGKSAQIEGMAANAGLVCETIVGSVHEPSDFTGLPVVTPNGVVMEAPAWAKNLAAAPNGGVAFFDELTTSAPAVQAAMLRVILNGSVGNVDLGPNVAKVAAANPPECAADGWELSAPLANRFLHLDWRGLSPDDWRRGRRQGWDTVTPKIVMESDAMWVAQAVSLIDAFIAVRPELLHAFPTDPSQQGKAWPSRRTWDMLADVLGFIDPADNAAVMIAACGLVGEGAGLEFAEWRNNLDLPDPEALLADPNMIDWNKTRADKVHVALSSVYNVVESNVTHERWEAAWAVLGAAAEGGRGDVAFAIAPRLFCAGDLTWTTPAVLGKFLPLLEEAGLIEPKNS